MVCSLVLLCSAAQAAEKVDPARTVTQLGTRFPISQVLDAANPKKHRTTVDHPVTNGAPPGAEVRYLRVYIEVEGGGAGRWYLTIRDKDLRPVEVLTEESFRLSRGRWSARVNGSRVLIDLDLADNAPETNKTRIVLKEYIAMPVQAETPYYSSQVPGHPEYRDLYKEADGDSRRLGDAVGFVMSSYNQESWCCSGVVVGDGLLLTNWHCGGKPDSTPEDAYWSPRACQGTLVDLSWDGDALSREFRCVEVLCRSRELDFAMLRIAPLGSGSTPKPASLRNGPPIDGESLTVIHHPQCLPKQITDNCAIEDSTYRGWIDATKADDFSHRCDTEGGSSGGAVFDSDGRLIGLHHTGFELTGDAMAREKRVNTAVRLDSILRYLESAPCSKECTADLHRLLDLKR